MESNLVTVNDLKTFTNIGKNVDEELLFPFLIISQQMHVAPVLGDALYNDIVNRFDNNWLTGDTQTLYEEYIIPAVGFSAWYASSIFLNLHTERAGIMTMDTDHSTHASVEEFGLYSKWVESLKDFYLRRLETFLNANITLFPLYRKTNLENSNAGPFFLGFNKKRKTSDYWDLDRGQFPGNCLP
jgi:hypothetical protein